VETEGRAVRTGALAALAAAAGAALVEALRAAVTGDPPLDVPGAALVGLHAFTLFAVAALPAGAALGAATRWLPEPWRPEALLARARVALGRADGSGGAALAGTLVGAALAVCGTFAAARLVAAAHNKALAALTLAVALVAVLAAAAVVGRSAAAAVQPLLRRAGRAGSGWAVLSALVAVGAAAVAAAAWRFRDLLDAIDLGFALVGAAALAGAALVALDPGPALRRRVALVATVVLLAGADVTLFRLRADEEVFSALTRRAALASFFWEAYAAVLDRDGDGVAAVLGGDDCDDGDATRAPGLLETADNGVDEDCDGVDLTVGASLLSLAAALPSAVAAPAAGAALPPSPETDSAAAPAAAAALPAMNVVHIMVDTMRVDRLGRARDGTPLTPYMDALANRGARFSYAYSTGPNTKYASPVFFTGRYFSEIPRNGASWVRIYDEAVTVAERVKASGAHTAGVSAHWWITAGSNLRQGFERWESEDREISGDRVADRGIRYLGERAKDGTPFYLWLHFYDVHNDWNPEPEWAIFGDCLLCRYDAEVRYTDYHIGRVLDALAKLGLDKNTAVVLHGDHGEAFGEHGMVHHGTSLYWEQIGVPMIIVIPGAAPRVVEEPVSTVDVARTVLDLMHVPADASLQGASLVPYASSDHPPPHPPVYSEIVRDPKHEDVRAWVEDGWKLIWWMEEGRTRLYHVASDPRETKDLAKDNPELVKLMKNKVQAFMSTHLVPYPVVIIPEPEDEVAADAVGGHGEGG
jgi:arylsulfatase A-like enzyme